MSGALSGLRILDLTRVLAGPICTQMLGDLGAEVIKIERPGTGDDTREWGPPFLQDEYGQDTAESAYYLCANRNKRSVAIDISRPEGQNLLHRLLAQCDVLVENFKVGSLAKYGLGYEQIRDRYPRLIYASITGFGQTGPLATEPGYDFLAQGMSGFMGVTGPIDGGPTKAGIAISDYVTGLYTVIGILAALNARTQTGRGQHVDSALLDCSIAMMTNVAQYFLTSGARPPRVGNAHTTVVPYQDFESADGHVIIVAGNDHQFRTLCTVMARTEWASDARFATNHDRVRHRDALLALMRPVIVGQTTAYWIEKLRAVDIPVGPIYQLDQVFTDPQVQAREMCIAMSHPASPSPVSLIGCALKLSDTPAHYQSPPPRLGAHTESVLCSLGGLSPADIETLRTQKVIG